MQRWRLPLILVISAGSFGSGLSAPSNKQEVVIDANAATTPLPQFLEQMFGSGRAILTLRDSYRSDLREVKKVTEFCPGDFHESDCATDVSKSRASLCCWQAGRAPC